MSDINDQLIIPPSIREDNTNNFELYLSGYSTKGALMIGKELNHLYSRKSTWPKFLKFTQENIPIPLENDETIQLVSCGIQNVILVTNHSKCYLFGDFKFGSYFSSYCMIKEEDFHYGTLLPFRMNNSTVCDKLNCKITHLDSGETFSIIRDDYNRYWYCGKRNFTINQNVIFEFRQLNNGELKLINNEKVTHFVVGGKHAVVCVDETTIFTIGNNFSSQLGKGQILLDNSFDKFIKVNWNEDKQLLVKQVVANGSSTIILTKCGKIFSTITSLNNNICSFQEVISPFVEDFNYLGCSWGCGYITSKSGGIYPIDEGRILNFTRIGGEEIKLFTGTNNSSKAFGFYTDNEAQLFDNDYSFKVNSSIVKTNLPIVYTKMSQELKLIFCARNNCKDLQFKLKLFKSHRYEDITIR
ncbi:hypothetical protein ABK040_009221 [Willaertia magna]